MNWRVFEKGIDIAQKKMGVVLDKEGEALVQVYLTDIPFDLEKSGLMVVVKAVSA